MIKRTVIGTTHVIAQCRNCPWRDEDYMKAITTARAHAEQTGHKVVVERAQSWVYNPKSGKDQERE